VILLAATDRPERIEPALLRSGASTYILPFAKPGVPIARRLFISVAGMCRLSPDIDFKELVRRMEGLTGADIESSVQKAALRDRGNSARHAAAPFVVTARRFPAGSELIEAVQALEHNDEPGGVAGIAP